VAVPAPAVDVRGLSRRQGERLALSDVSLEVPPGSTAVVRGPNGAGKTTLLKVLATLLRPHAGTVRVLGEPLPERAWAVRGRIGYLGHEPLLYRDLTPRENLRFHARLHDVDPGRGEKLLERVGLTLRADDPVRTFSRGMVQRVALCRALLHDPELVLLDEPRAHLDADSAALLAPLLAGRTRVVVTHDPDERGDVELRLG
jgi:heme ABC exporter ATP-binding subunit CcmA